MKRRQILQLLSILLVLTACVVLVVVKIGGSRDGGYVAAPLASESPAALERKKPVFIEETHDIDIDIVSDGLKDMGVLVTSEYYFRDVIDYSEARTVFGFKLPFTESSFVASYDGVVTAGVDFKRIAVIKDDARRIITITIPKASVINIDIDTGSFILYSEKDGLGTKIDIAEFNASLDQLRESSKANAIDKGLLEKADDNAVSLVQNFVEGLVVDYDYSVVVKSSK